MSIFSQLYSMPPLSPTLYPSVLPETYPYPPLPSDAQTLYNPNPNPTPSTSAVPVIPISRTSRTTPAKIPRPPNAFMLFRSHFLKSGQIPHDQECQQQTISCVVGECWNMLSPEDKAVWKAKAEEAKRLHMLRYPGYKFNPTPRGTKVHARRAVAAKGVKGKAISYSGEEGDEESKRERTRRLREEYTQFKGEAELSQRRKKQLARSVRGTRVGLRSRKATTTTAESAYDADVSQAPTPSSSSLIPSTVPPNSTTSTVDAPSNTHSKLYAPRPLRHIHGPFAPSSTRLTPAPSNGPEIIRLAQSPPLTPFHPTDRLPQLQQLECEEVVLSRPVYQQPEYQQEQGFEWEAAMGVGMSSYSADESDNATSAYFAPREVGLYNTMQVSDDNLHFNYSFVAPNDMNTQAQYPTLTLDGNLATFMGPYRDTTQSLYGPTSSYSSNTLGFSPALSPLSPAWSSEAQSPSSSCHSSQPQTPEIPMGSNTYLQNGTYNSAYPHPAPYTAQTQYNPHYTSQGRLEMIDANNKFGPFMQQQSAAVGVDGHYLYSGNAPQMGGGAGALGLWDTGMGMGAGEQLDIEFGTMLRL